MRTILVIASLCLWSTVAAAQPPLPECKDLPNGGKLIIDIPGVFGPAGCRACVQGVNIPPNFVLGFSNDSHDTCELKRPDGTNSGTCKADSQCPPGTTRAQQNGVWACQAPRIYKEITCPAPPRIPDPPKPPQTVTTCIARLKDAASRVSTAAAGFVAAVGGSKPGGGATPGSIGGAGVQAGAMAVLIPVHFYGNLLPLTLKKKATCDNADPNNRTAVADCNAARADLSTSRDRMNGLKYKFRDAARITKREIEEATTANPAVKDAGSTLTTEVDNFERDAEICMTEIVKITP